MISKDTPEDKLRSWFNTSDQLGELVSDSGSF